MILAAPSITWTKSSYIDPVISNTKARVAAPGGIFSCGVTKAGHKKSTNRKQHRTDTHIVKISQQDLDNGITL